MTTRIPGRIHITAARRLSDSAFELAKGTTLMAAFVRNSVQVELRRYYDGANFWTDGITRLSPEVNAFLDANCGGHFYVRHDGDHVVVYFEKAADAVAFKLRYHDTAVG